jgi:signal transduction histidine kinase
MRKVLFATTLASAIIVCLQAIWICNAYRSYATEQLMNTNEILNSSIGQELINRQKNNFSNLKRHKLSATTMSAPSPEYIKKHKTEIIDLSSNKLGKNKTIAEAIQQYSQDIETYKHNPLKLTVLDSIFKAQIKTGNKKEPLDLKRYCIISYNKDSIMTSHIGNLPPNRSWGTYTDWYPIGTKGLQYIRAKVEIPISDFLLKMIGVLTGSAVMIFIALGCIAYQLIVIRRKDRQFEEREKSVNGTIHDLKSPLNGIIMLMNWMKSNEEDDTKKRMMGDTSLQASHLVNDIEALLITARRDRRRVLIQKTEMDLMQTAQKVKEQLDIQYNQKQHTINIISSTKIITVKADAMYMGNVFRNLMENALKYSDDGVEVIVELSLSQNHFVQVSIKDNGWGINKKYQKKVFEQFYQVPRSNEKLKRGYGIGLPYTKYIIEAHGGKMKLESEPDKGSIFTFWLPDE